MHDSQPIRGIFLGIAVGGSMERSPDGLQNRVALSDAAQPWWIRQTLILANGYIQARWGRINAQRHGSSKITADVSTANVSADAVSATSSSRLDDGQDAAVQDYFRQIAPDLALAKVDAGQLAIATIPLAMVLYEDTDTLRQAFRHLATVWSIPSHLTTAVLTMLNAVAFLLHQPQTPNGLMQHLIETSQSESDAADWTAQLLDVQALTSSTTPAPIAINQITRGLLPSQRTQYPETRSSLVSLYGFLTAFDEPGLAVHRLLWLLKQQVSELTIPSTCALLGGLLGAYHGAIALPLDWQFTFFNQEDSPPSTLIERDGKTDLMIDWLADQLTAAWRGETNPAANYRVSDRLAITAPRVISPDS
jgi:hypothetical protein